MDNKKVGKLIAKLRKEKELTQQQLGDKVGVGFRAVSKWERGLTMPDIGIINELSKILGISSDELLSGELKKTKPNKKKISLKLKVTISIIISLILIIFSILFYYNNKTYVYSIASNNESEYNIEGQVTIRKGKISIIVSKLRFKNENFNSTIIQNYQYDIYVNNEYVFGYGYIMDMNALSKGTNIEEFLENFRINYIGNIDKSKKEILKDNISIVFKFIDKNDDEIVKEVKFALHEQIKNNNS